MSYPDFNNNSFPNPGPADQGANTPGNGVPQKQQQQPQGDMGTPMDNGAGGFPGGHMQQMGQPPMGQPGQQQPPQQQQPEPKTTLW